MRMWMVPPHRMCRQHLLGEHVEIHMAVASLRRGRSLAGFLAGGLLELGALRRRHDALAAEMLRRGYRHASPLGRVPRRRGGKVDRRQSARELAARCPECRARCCRPARSEGPLSSPRSSRRKGISRLVGNDDDHA